MTLYFAKTWVGILTYNFVIFFLRTKGLSGLNLLLGNDLHLLFVIFQTSSIAFVMEINMPIKDVYYW